MSSDDNQGYSDTEEKIPTKCQYSKNTNLYVKNFGYDMTEGELCELFDAYGTITSCKIAKDDFDQSRGFGYVNFQTSAMAAEAIENLNDCPLENGKRLCVCLHQSKEDREAAQRQQGHMLKDCNLFIGNLDEGIDDKMLKQAFARYGTITSAKVETKNGQSRGYGYVCFLTPKEAAEAILEMDRQVLGSKPIYVTIWKSRQERTQSVNRQNTPNIKLRSTSTVRNTSKTPLSPSNTPRPVIRQFSTRLYPPHPSD